MRNLLFVSVVGCMLASSAQAAITFTLKDVMFSDWATASGSFTTDDAATRVIDYNIATSSGFFSADPELYLDRMDAPAFNYNKDTAGAKLISGDGFTSIYFVVPDEYDQGRGIGLNFVTPSVAGETSIWGLEGVFVYNREIEAGVVFASKGVVVPNPDDGGPTAGVVPEPSMWAMMIGGFGLVGSKMRRRKGAVATGFSFA
ncbi:PEPxxWA-CTERM sorting domain-containing protein [Polymorphobacter sp. PAMC 29334]|uniref:PEPxxWA-CTERM sorting domain-containing protein n=1 Tax=Polymorphobacter sp. PAMC 29334 TaxID=2862331 RepID=UPI001D00CD62|nr:PEPxxWA-CTERM sorting domain-containing protein [Polymorphobacter sp. PAMC 29334]